MLSVKNKICCVKLLYLFNLRANVMKTLVFFLIVVMSFVFLPCSDATAHHSVTITPECSSYSQKNANKVFKKWKVQRKRHRNPAPIFLIVALLGAAGAVAVYFLTELVVLAAVLGGIAFIGFILYFVYSGAN